MNNQSFSKIWILVILTLFIVGGGIFAWQYFGTPKGEVIDETANWKEFIDSKIAYSFKYPQDWIVSTNGLGGHDISKSIEGKIYGSIFTQFAAWKDFEKTQGKITFEKYVEQVKGEHLSDTNVKNFKEEKMMLGEKEAVKFSYETPDRQISVPGQSGVKLGELVSEVYLQTDKGVFYLAGSAVREKETYYPIVNQILSTFRFLK